MTLSQPLQWKTALTGSAAAVLATAKEVAIFHTSHKKCRTFWFFFTLGSSEAKLYPTKTTLKWSTSNIGTETGQTVCFRDTLGSKYSYFTIFFFSLSWNIGECEWILDEIWISNGFNVKWFECHEKCFIITIQSNYNFYYDEKEKEREREITQNWISVLSGEQLRNKKDNVWQLGRLLTQLTLTSRLMAYQAVFDLDDCSLRLTLSPALCLHCKPCTSTQATFFCIWLTK